MTNEHKRQLTAYVTADLLSTAAAMWVFGMLRFWTTPWISQHYDSVWQFLGMPAIVLSMTAFPAGMLLVYALTGVYVYNFSRSRTNELLATVVSALIGDLVYFLTALLNDANLATRTWNYEQMVLLFLLLLFMVWAPRYAITTHYMRLTRRGLRQRPTLIVGTSDEAVALAGELRGSRRGMGLSPVGYVQSVPDTGGHEAKGLDLPVYPIDEVEQAVAATGAKCLVIVLHKQGRKASMQLINRLFPLDLPLFLSPDRYNMLLSRSRFDDITGEPLIDVSRTDQTPATLAIKRACDVVFSTVALIATAPVVALLAACIRAEGPGPVFYSQVRIGYHKRPFRIFKLRSMRPDAEAAGPALSSATDTRVTRVGAFMRKYRLDELPNFWNVLRGDMSMVGPRPEREHFIKQIVKKAPYYTLVHQVRPGITSWGMVKYGYASTVDQMVERLRYDMVYIENMSISVDIKILFYTVSTVVTGRGV